MVTVIILSAFVFVFLDYNNYFIQDVTTITLEEIDHKFDTRFSEIGFWYKENQSHSLLFSKSTSYDVYGSFDFEGRMYYLKATIAPHDEKPSRYYNFNKNQSRSIHIHYEKTNDYRINVVAKSSTNEIVDKKVVEPAYHISIETPTSNYFVYFSEVINKVNHTIDFANPDEVEAVSNMLKIVKYLMLNEGN